MARTQVSFQNLLWLMASTIWPKARSLSAAWAAGLKSEHRYAVVHDSSRRTEPVIFPLAPGSHVLEVAYREAGAEIARLVVEDDLGHPPPCGD